MERKGNISRVDSQTIDFLRFPMMVAVCFIHANIGEYKFGPIIPSDFRLFDIVYTLIGNGVSRIAVPLFFAISGYLFFNKLDQFSAQAYLVKLKRRITSLFLPYVFWNLLYCVIWLMIANLAPSLSSSSVIGSYKEFNLVVFIRSFWDIIGGKFPADSPTWFLRDLIVINLFAPVIFFLCKKLRFIFVILLGLAWFFDLVPNLFIRIDGMFFFSLGAFFMIYKRNPAVLYTPSRLIIGGGMYIFSLLLMIFYDFFIRLQILLGLVFVVSITSYLVTRGTLSSNKFLKDSNFFIYLYHALPIAFVGKLLLRQLGGNSNIILIAIYFLTVIITVAFGLLLFKVLISNRLTKRINVIIGIKH